MTDVATKARNLAQHCEAKKHALRQTQDGIVVAFVLHPSDVPASLQLAPLGTRYMLALVEIGDDEQPKEVMGNRHVSNGSLDKTSPASDQAASPAVPVRAKTPFTSMSYGQQAGLLSNDAKFIRFLCERFDFTKIEPGEPAAIIVRDYCGVQSRAEIRPNTEAANRWLLLLSAYRAWEQAPACGVA